VALFTTLGLGDGYLLLAAMGGFFERNLHVIAQILATLGLVWIVLRRTEQVLEYAATPEDLAEYLERIVKAASPSKATGAPVKGGMAVLIVGRALLRIVENLIRFAQLLKLFLGGFVARVLVRMILYSKFSVGLLDLLFRRALL
jgi:hypothetical protein